jgi:acyl transferase domain-containing protein/phosphopantetheinyl transferase
VSSSADLASTNSSTSGSDIAIVGMACIFPGASDVQTYWQNIIGKIDAISDPPDDWEADLYYDPDSNANDRIYCKRGGYLGELARFDPIKYGIMPNSINGGEPDQFLALQVAYQALADSRYSERPVDTKRVGVIIGRGTYINRGFTTVVQHGLVVDETLRVLKQLHPEHTDDEFRAIKRELKASLPPFNAEMAPALVPNVISGRIANRLNFMGPNYTVDAACASSLIAVDLGMQDLLNRKCDLVVVGGVHASTPAPILMIFCQLNALSRRGQIRPFDKDADGTLLGEGVGFIILKRREDAERDGDRVYALIKGIGTASDGRGLGLLAPRVEGEELALERAYKTSGIDPRTVELIEAHGTGTTVGDLTEIKALRSIFGPRVGKLPWCAVGSVKSMISHLLPAAGIAGIIKSALALYYKVLPPTLHSEEPDPKLELESTPFYINTETRPWIHGARTPRRAGVNAFGFGGINAHVLMEEYPVTDRSEATTYHQWDTEVCILQGDARPDLIRECERLKGYVSGTPRIEMKDLAYTLNSGLNNEQCRLAIVASSLPELEQKLDSAIQRLTDPQCKRIRDQSGIYFFQEPLSRSGKLAFLFPGEGSQYINMLADLCLNFPEVRTWFDLIDRAFIDHKRNYVPSQIVFPSPTGRAELKHDFLWQMDCGPEAVFTANQAISTLLDRLQIRPQVVVGHSTGDYSALIAAGANQIPDEEYLVRGIVELNELYEQLCVEGEIPEALLVAVGGADRKAVLSLIDHHNGLYLAMDNCPHQIVVCGAEAEIDLAVKELQSKGAVCIQLPFKRAYHTSMFTPFCDRLAECFGGLNISSPEIQIYSCTTAQPYPDEPAEMRKLVLEQWARPVRFRETIEAMYEGGVRIFVEVGPRNNLTSMVDDILRGKSYVAAASNLSNRSGIAQLNHLVAMLAAHGVGMQLDYLYARRAPQRLSFEKDGEMMRKSSASSAPMRLLTALQPLRLGRDRVQSLGNDSANHSASQSRVSTNSRKPIEIPNLATRDLSSSQILPASANEQPGCTDPVASAETERQASSAYPTQAVNSEVASGDRSAVLREHLQTMEKFLKVQQDVMRVFLNGVAEGNSSTPRFRKELDSKICIPTEEPKQVETASHQPTAVHVRSVALPEQTPSDTSASDGSVRKAPGQGEVPSVASEEHPPSSENMLQILLQLISERTGYPIGMLDPVLNLEADLGIDSIKRVEILGTFQRQTGLLSVQDMDRVTSLKTLQQIIDFIRERDQETHDRVAVSFPQQRNANLAMGNSQTPSFPFIRSVISLVPGRELVALCKLDVDEDLFLKDHTLGGQVSSSDDGLIALPVLPLAISMEMLLEAAAMLLPEKLVVGMKNIRAYRWIAVDESSLTLEISARRNASAREVQVQVKESADSAAHGGLHTPIVEGIVVFDDRYPDMPRIGAFPLRSEGPSKWTPGQLYKEVMFHGPSFQAVASVDRWGEDGTEGTLKVLPSNRLFRSISSPRFLTDPVLLDATGQLVGYWTAEHLASGFHVFPYRVEEVHIYGPNLRPGELAKCRARIAMVGQQQLRSDIDVIGPAGQLLVQLIGWWDRRFDLPDRFYRLRISPNDTLLSKSWPAAVAHFATPEAFSCCLLDELSYDLLESHGRIWQRVLAHLVLSRSERLAWRNLKGPEKRRIEWLLGRTAAKDAVRSYMKQHHGVSLYPADIEIEQDEHGKPLARGKWAQTTVAIPAVSLAHAGGVAVAVAGNDRQCRGVGIDIERMHEQREEFESIAFASEERTLLMSLDGVSKGEWILRLWCAKEALAKALGRGMIEGPQGLRIRNVDVHTGLVTLALLGQLAKEFPDLARKHIEAYTARENNLVFAISTV